MEWSASVSGSGGVPPTRLLARPASSLGVGPAASRGFGPARGLHVTVRVGCACTCPGSGGAGWKAYVEGHRRKVKRRIRKGIPNEFRGLAWHLLSGGRDLQLQNEGAALVGRSRGGTRMRLSVYT
jgi:hypothetical protein